MKYRTALTLALILLFGLGVQSAWTQDTEQEPFVRGLIRAVERMNWEISETGALERSLSMYEWKRFEEIDPEVVALALSYSKERGIGEPEKYAELAMHMAESIGEMNALGFSSRESARAIMNGMRSTAADSPDIAAQLRTQVRQQMHDATGAALRKRVEARKGRAHSGNTWTPPAPKERPGGGRADIPAKPSDPPRGSEGAPGNGHGGN